MNRKLQSSDPCDGSFLGEVAVTQSEEIKATVEAARTAAGHWSKVSPEERVSCIQTAYAAAEPHVSRLSELLSREMGKDIRRATGEVHGTVFGGPYIAGSAQQAVKTTYIGRSAIEYAPLGVVAVISPWNYPLAMANNLIVPALAAGNSVIWKPSEETPLIAQAFYELIHELLPENVLSIIHGNGVQGRMLVESDVDMIAFTGSQATGIDIMQRTAGQFKRLVMELGGNDPMIVMKDADIQAAARFAVASSFENAGQMCTSTERIYVDAMVADEFEKLVVEIASRYVVGPWNLEGVNIGPINNLRQHEVITRHIQDAADKGARILLGGTGQTAPYINPTVISGMTAEMLIEQEETFGPVVCISSYTDLEDAVSRANNSTYGLGAVVFGGNDADRVAGRLQAGMVGVNQGVGGEGDSPWVGAKQSGVGFHGSPDGHKQFAQVRVVNR